MPAATHWTVIAVLGDGRGNGTCGHIHATSDEATLCPWTPDPWPVVCDLLVRHVRSDDGRRRKVRAKDRQLAMFDERKVAR